MWRQLTPSFLLLTVLLVWLFAISNTEESTPSAAHTEEAKKLTIVPLVTLKPGETKELLLSTWCTVGVTRGGGFSLAEMRDGKPHFNGSTLSGNRSYSRDGVSLSVPSWDENEAFASSSEYGLLKERNVDAFKVTVAASSTAKSGLLEMHLVDATCAGHCTTDFRVLVVGD